MKITVKIFLSLVVVIIMSTSTALGLFLENRIITNSDKFTYTITNNILTISWGEKPTGGYSIKITDLKLDNNDNLLVYYKTESPKEGDFVTQVITYPKDRTLIPVELRRYKDIKLIEKKEKTEDVVTYSIIDGILTISWGEKPTGGYSIKITNLELDKNDNLLVYYKTESLKEGDFVTQVISRVGRELFSSFPL